VFRTLQNFLVHKELLWTKFIVTLTSEALQVTGHYEFKAYIKQVDSHGTFVRFARQQM
jgi:hypothetical protein